MQLVKYDFYFQKPHDQLGDCPVCIVTLENDQELVAHDHGGDKHPIHLHCLIQTIANKINKCPTCQANINMPYLKSLANRKVTEISFVKKDLEAGIFIAARTISLLLMPLIACKTISFLFNSELVLLLSPFWIRIGAPLGSAFLANEPHNNPKDKDSTLAGAIATIIATQSAFTKIFLAKEKLRDDLELICTQATLSAILSGVLGGLLISKKAAKIAAIAGFAFVSLAGSIGVTTRTLSNLPNAIIDMSLILMAGTVSAMALKIIDASPNITRSTSALTTAALAGLILPTYVANNNYIQIFASLVGVISGAALGSVIGGFLARRKVQLTLYDLS